MSIKVSERHVLRPGDRLLLTVDRDATAEQVGYLRDRVTQRFPDIDVVILAGVGVTIVERDE